MTEQEATARVASRACDAYTPGWPVLQGAWPPIAFLGADGRSPRRSRSPTPRRRCGRSSPRRARPATTGRSSSQARRRSSRQSIRTPGAARYTSRPAPRSTRCAAKTDRQRHRPTTTARPHTLRLWEPGMWCGSRSPACPGSFFSATCQPPYACRVYSRGESQHVLRLQSITDAALAHLELEELLRELLYRIRAILDVDTCAILLVDE